MGFFCNGSEVEDGSKVLQLLFSALLLCCLHVVCWALYRMSVRQFVGWEVCDLNWLSSAVNAGIVYSLNAADLFLPLCFKHFWAKSTLSLPGKTQEGWCPRREVMIVFLNFNYKINITPEELSCQNEHSRLQTSSGRDTVLISSVEPLTQLGSCVALCSFDTLSARGREGRKEVDSPTSQFKWGGTHSKLLSTCSCFPFSMGKALI